MEIGEAIKILENIKMNGLSRPGIPVIKNTESNAIDMAIKALKEKNKETEK